MTWSMQGVARSPVTKDARQLIVQLDAGYVSEAEFLQLGVEQFAAKLLGHALRAGVE